MSVHNTKHKMTNRNNANLLAKTLVRRELLIILFIFLDPTGSLAFTLWVMGNYSFCYVKLEYLNTLILEYLDTWILKYLNT